MPTAEDGPLPGGTANQGQVVRVGDTVRRPRGEHTPAVHALLRHLTRSGFDGSPRVLALRRHTEVLGYLPGTTALDPLPAWALTDEALSSVGRLLADFHRHTAGFVASERRWQCPVPARWRTDLVTHNDAHPANVVFRDGRAVGLIDFDLAAPGSRTWELATAVCYWTPLLDPVDIADARRDERLHRVRVLLDGYGADAALRADVAAACGAANRWIAAIIRDASERGHPAFGRKWAAQAAMFDRADAWVNRNYDRLAAAVR